MSGCVALLVASCGIAARNVEQPPAAATASVAPSTTPAIALTRAQLVAALSPAGLQLTDPQLSYRPAESHALAAAPRAVFQVPLPEDLQHGFIVVYEFPDQAAATAAGREMAAYIVTGPGRIQFFPDSQFILRQVGTTLVFFTWSPNNSPDPRTPTIAQALRTVGTEIPVGP